RRSNSGCARAAFAPGPEEKQAMSNQPHPTPPGTAALQPQTIRVVSHTTLFYWWPVWLVGFILAGLTYADGTRLAVLPPGTTVQEVEPNKVYELTVPDEPSPSLQRAAASTAKGQDAFPVRMATNRDYGMVYITVLLLVIFGANVPLRGLASV